MELKKSLKNNLEDKRLLFFQIGLVVSIVLAILALEWNSVYEIKIPIKKNIIDEVVIEIIDIPNTKPAVKRPPPPSISKNISTKELSIRNIIPEKKIISKKSIIEPTSLYYIEPPDEIPEKFIIYDTTEHMPKFNGMHYSFFRKYISKKLRFPNNAVNYMLSGTVYVQFIVNYKGDVVNVEITKGIDPLLDNAVKEVVESSPRWEPGRQGLKPVNVRFTFPVKFVII